MFKLFPGLAFKPWKVVNLNVEFLKNAHLDMRKIPDQVKLLDIASRTNTVYSYGGYGEDRSDIWKGFEPETKRMIHLGLDFNNLPALQPVTSVIDGQIILTAIDDSKFNGWGGRIFVKNDSVLAMYGHLDVQTLPSCREVKKGDIIGWIGMPNINGGWFPHLHLQVMDYKYVNKFSKLEDINGYADEMPEGVLNPMDFIYLM